MVSLASLKQRALRLKAEIFVLALAVRHPATPWYVRLLLLAVVAYAVSPIDLIPDFVPVLGYLDDLILLPLGIALAIRLLPEAVLVECRHKVDRVRLPLRRAGYVAATLVVTFWLLLILLCLRWLAG